MNQKNLIFHLRNAYELLRAVAQEGSRVAQDDGGYRRVDKATAALLALRLVLQKLEHDHGHDEEPTTP